MIVFKSVNQDLNHNNITSSITTTVITLHTHTYVNMKIYINIINILNVNLGTITNKTKIKDK